MAAIQDGRTCTLRRGRRVGEEVEVVKVLEDYALVKDKKGKERKVSITHLEPKA